MNDLQSQFIKKILADTQTSPQESGTAFAPSNIALCKYWGKRSAALNLPVNSSLSISLGQLGTDTEIELIDGVDLVYLNGQPQTPDSAFAKRVSTFLDPFRPFFGGAGFEVVTKNTIPTAAGLASSASGFAALAMALNDLAGWGLDGAQVSMLARLGSGSAARSVFNGFVQWNAGIHPDGTDSFAERLEVEWPDFRIGIVEVCSAAKPIGSRDGMNRTVETSVLYQSWPLQAAADLAAIRRAVMERDFLALGIRAERNALSMHATMMSAWPPLIYLRPESMEMIARVHRLREEDVEVYLTIDAGPNIKLLFLAENEPVLRETFPELQVIHPFGS